MLHKLYLSGTRRMRNGHDWYGEILQPFASFILDNTVRHYSKVKVSNSFIVCYFKHIYVK